MKLRSQNFEKRLEPIRAMDVMIAKHMRGSPNVLIVFAGRMPA
jgi:hypothetical protein